MLMNRCSQGAQKQQTEGQPDKQENLQSGQKAYCCSASWSEFPGMRDEFAFPLPISSSSGPSVPPRKDNRGERS
jgi:hypothetical protein